MGGFFSWCLFFWCLFFFDAYPIFKVSMLDFCIVYSFHTVDCNQKSGQKQTSWYVGTISPLFTGFRTCQVVVWDLFPSTVWSTVVFYLFKKKNRMGVPPEVHFSGWKQRNHYISKSQKASKIEKRKTSRKQKFSKLEINYNQKSSRRPKQK